MEQQVLDLVSKLAAGGQNPDVLALLSRCACAQLSGMLAQEVSPQDCAEAYCLAAAWMVLDWLEQMDGGMDVTALTAGDLSVRREGKQAGRLRSQALELMAPYLRDEGFVFREVRG